MTASANRPLVFADASTMLMYQFRTKFSFGRLATSCASSTPHLEAGWDRSQPSILSAVEVDGGRQVRRRPQIPLRNRRGENVPARGNGMDTRLRARRVDRRAARGRRELEGVIRLVDDKVFRPARQPRRQGAGSVEDDLRAVRQTMRCKRDDAR